MARFRFSMEPVLRTRRQAERVQQRAVAELEAQRRRLEDSLRQRQEAIDAGKVYAYVCDFPVRSVLRVVPLFLLPHGEHRGGDFARYGQSGQVGPRAGLGQPHVVVP